jgi:hypothetical protein
VRCDILESGAWMFSAILRRLIQIARFHHDTRHTRVAGCQPFGKELTYSTGFDDDVA